MSNAGIIKSKISNSSTDYKPKDTVSKHKHTVSYIDGTE